ncbi:hypothetical protein [Amycolatopsis vastitatis]|uniref:hypothetical protein n=1 Tax=Amycolatopsis vastitatis TaxID=1905142 RepID=UPI00117794DB|nr:hypothetical protein [Amycolatopsis vastitatis]
MSGSDAPARRSRKEWVVRLLAVMVLAYLAGVGISYAFGRPDPWIAGLIAVGPALGGVAGPALVRRARGGT